MPLLAPGKEQLHFLSDDMRVCSLVPRIPERNRHEVRMVPGTNLSRVSDKKSGMLSTPPPGFRNLLAGSILQAKGFNIDFFFLSHKIKVVYLRLFSVNAGLAGF